MHDLLIVASNNIYDSFNDIPEQVISDKIDSYQDFYTFIHRDNEVEKLIQSFTNSNELFTNFTSIVKESKTKKIEKCDSKKFDDILNDFKDDFVTMPEHDKYNNFKKNVFDRFNVKDKTKGVEYINIVIAKLEEGEMKIQKNNITDTNKSFREILAERADGKKPYLEFETTQDYTRYIRIDDLQIFLQDIIKLEKNLSDLNNRTCGFTIGDDKTDIETIKKNSKTFFDECKDIIDNFETIFNNYGSFTPEGSTLLLIENPEGFDETDFKTITFESNIYKYLQWFYNNHIRDVIIAFYKKCQEIKSEIDLISKQSSINKYNFNNTKYNFGKIYLLFISLYVYKKYGWGRYKKSSEIVDNKWTKKVDILDRTQTKNWNEEKDINGSLFKSIYTEIDTLIRGLEIFDDKYLKFPPKSSDSVYSILVPYFFSGNIQQRNRFPSLSENYKLLTFEGKDKNESEEKYEKIVNWFDNESNQEHLTGFNYDGFWGNNLTSLFLQGSGMRIVDPLNLDPKLKRLNVDYPNLKKSDLFAHNKTFLYFDKIKIRETENITLDEVCSLLYSNIVEGDYDNKNDILDDENFRVNFAKFVVLFSFLFNSTHSVPKTPPDEKRGNATDIITFVNTINSKNCVAGKSGSSSGKPGPSSGEKFKNPLCDRKGRPKDRPGFNLNTNPNSDIPIGTSRTGTPRKENTGIKTYPNPSKSKSERVLGTARKQSTATGPGTTSGKSSSGHVSRRVVRPTGNPPLPVTTGKLTQNRRGGKKTKRIRRGKRTRHNKKKITRPLRKIKSNLTKKK